MRKEPLLARHWDARLPHAAYFATRDVLTGEELTYRRDEAVWKEKKASTHAASAACAATPTARSGCDRRDGGQSSSPTPQGHREHEEHDSSIHLSEHTLRRRAFTPDSIVTKFKIFWYE